MMNALRRVDMQRLRLQRIKMRNSRWNLSLLIYLLMNRQRELIVSIWFFILFQSCWEARDLNRAMDLSGIYGQSSWKTTLKLNNTKRKIILDGGVSLLHAIILYI